jgi:competence protein ComEC
LSEKYRKYEGIAQIKNESLNAVFYLPKNSRDLDFIHYYKGEAFITQPYSPQYDFQFDYARYLNRKILNIRFIFQGSSFLQSELT